MVLTSWSAPTGDAQSVCYFIRIATQLQKVATKSAIGDQDMDLGNNQQSQRDHAPHGLNKIDCASATDAAQLVRVTQHAAVHALPIHIRREAC